MHKKEMVDAMLVVFEVVKNNLPSMLTIIKKMRTELPLHEI